MAGCSLTSETRFGTLKSRVMSGRTKLDTDRSERMGPEILIAAYLPSLNGRRAALTLEH